MRLVGAGDDQQARWCPCRAGGRSRAARGRRRPPSSSPSASTRVGPRVRGRRDGRPARPACRPPPGSRRRWTIRALGAQLTVRSAPAGRRQTSSTTPARDRDVGEVEGRPERQVDEVGDGVDPHPVGEVAERAAGEQADGEPEPGRCGSRANRYDEQRQGGQRRARSPPAPPPPARPKAMPLLWTLVRTRKPSRSTRSPGTRFASSDRLGRLVEGDDEPAERHRPRRQGAESLTLDQADEQRLRR